MKQPKILTLLTFTTLCVLSQKPTLGGSLILTPGNPPLVKKEAKAGDIIDFAVTFDPMAGAAMGDLSDENIDKITFEIKLYDELALLQNTLATPVPDSNINQNNPVVVDFVRKVLGIPLDYRKFTTPTVIATFQTLVTRKPINDNMPDIELIEGVATVEGLIFDYDVALPTMGQLSVIDSPPKKRKRDPKQNHQGNSKVENRSDIEFNSLDKKLSFGNTTIDTVFLNGDILSLSDPILNGEILIGDTDLLGTDLQSRGWFFEDTSYEVVVGDITVLTADLINPFLFNQVSIVPSEIHGLPEDLIFDSEFQALMDNIVINNVINSPYLDDLQENIDNGKERFVSVFSDIVSSTNDFATDGTSQAIVWDDGVKTPEPTSPLGLLAIGIGGVALNLNRKLKKSESTEKKTTKVG